MNFIDKVLENKGSMNADDFLQTMVGIYSEADVWNKIKKYPQFVRDIIYIIDYDTELQMEGLSGFFSDLTKEHYEETHTALTNFEICF